MAFFLCFPFAALAFFWPDTSIPHHQRHEYLVSFALPALGGACLFSLMGCALFLPVATSCRLTLDLRQKRWTLERSLWRWKEKVEGTTEAFARVMWKRDNESGPMAWLYWKERRVGNIALMIGDSSTLTAQSLAQDVATALGIPLHGLERGHDNHQTRNTFPDLPQGTEQGSSVPDTSTLQRSKRKSLMARFALPLLLGITLLNSYGGGLTLVRHWRDGAGRRFVSSNSLWKTHTICVDAQGQVIEAQAASIPFDSSTRNTGPLPEGEGDTSHSTWSLLLGANAEKALAQARQDAITYARMPRPLSGSLSGSGSKSGIRRFQYDNNSDSPKGPRYWSQTSPMEWQERDDTGLTTKFRVEQRTTVEGDAGITAHKLDGTSLRVFIPDRGSRKMRLRFRYEGQPSWTDLGEMTHIE